MNSTVTWCVLAESDNESAPSSTPTKNASPDEAQTETQNVVRNKSQELLLLDKIQAEAAAFYKYDSLPPPEPAKERKINRTNLSTKYDRLSLDELAGKRKEDERRSSLDFKVLSLDEIRAKKKCDVVHTPQITLNLSRKRKLSTQESVTTSGEKIIKVVRSNSIVYKQLERNTPASHNRAKVGRKLSESETSRKRTISEVSDVCEIQEDELVDNCFEFKKIKVAENVTQNKPRLIRNRNTSDNKDSNDNTNDPDDSFKTDNELQIVSVDITKDSVDLDLNEIYDCEIIDVDRAGTVDPVDIVDLSEDVDDDVNASDLDLDLTKNVPDVVASCRRSSKYNSDNNVSNDIDVIINDDL